MERDTEYSPNDSFAPEQRAYGAVSDPTTRNATFEDREAEESEVSGRVSKREVDDLRADAGNIGQVKGTRHQGKSNDAYKQERQLDQALSDEGAI
ncbi:hypothetical protein ACEPAI_7259 [Sanghuangporus weigelae]